MRTSNETASQRAAFTPSWRSGADWAAAIAVLAFWLISRPYRGVRHDAILYLGQTLRRLMPDRFASDLFLQSGAQDKYSLFSPLMAPVVSHFGVGASELVLLVACNLLFMLAVWKMSEGWFDRPLRWAVMMLVAVLPHTYGGLGEFSYAEPFLTARSIAEPLALFSLWQLLRGRLAAAIALACLSTAFHPLIIFPVLIIGWIVLILRRRSWAWLGVLFIVPAILAALGVAPFDGLGRTFDASWLAAIKAPNAQVFAAAYGRLDWSPLAFDALVLLLLLRSKRIPVALGQLVRATLVAVVVLTIAWVLGVDVLRNVLLTQLQLWRVYWPMHLFAVMALPLVLAECWSRGWVGRWCAAALGVAAIAVVSNWNTGWACILWALAALAVDHWRAAVSDVMAKGAVLASFVAMGGITAKVGWFTLQAVRNSPDNFDDASPLLIVLGLPLVGGLLIVGLLWMLASAGGPRAVAMIATAAGAAFGVQMWDQRSDWERRLEASMAVGPPAFDAQIPLNASVYWDYDVITPWLLARRGNFFSYNQGAGLLFDRATALEFARRSALLEGVTFQRELCKTIESLTRTSAAPKQACTPTVQVAAELCHNAVHPDYLVFAGPMSVPPLAEWHERTRAAGNPGKSFYLYSCSTF